MNHKSSIALAALMLGAIACAPSLGEIPKVRHRGCQPYAGKSRGRMGTRMAPPRRVQASMSRRERSRLRYSGPPASYHARRKQK